ncbi:hypothetical protein C8J57DRAFT_1467807 [Mycena rebaudengoi]|nr:hypothetical protein C8J57DRAFT_1467807 [Mycena rebaudengoi]
MSRLYLPRARLLITASCMDASGAWGDTPGSWRDRRALRIRGDKTPHSHPHPPAPRAPPSRAPSPPRPCTPSPPRAPPILHPPSTTTGSRLRACLLLRPRSVLLRAAPRLRDGFLLAFPPRTVDSGATPARPIPDAPAAQCDAARLRRGWCVLYGGMGWAWACGCAGGVAVLWGGRRGACARDGGSAVARRARPYSESADGGATWGRGCDAEGRGGGVPACEDEPAAAQSTYALFSLWLAQAELSVFSYAPRTIYRSVSYQFAFHPLGEDYDALIRRYKLDIDIGGAKIAVRKEVEGSYSAGAAGGGGGGLRLVPARDPHRLAFVLPQLYAHPHHGKARLRRLHREMRHQRAPPHAGSVEASVPCVFDEFVVPPGIADEDDVFLRVHVDRREHDDATSRNGEASVASPATSVHALEAAGAGGRGGEERGGVGRGGQARIGGGDFG